MKLGICSTCQSKHPLRRVKYRWVLDYHIAFGRACEGQDSVPEVVLN
jgi:hypothetical protein